MDKVVSAYRKPTHKTAISIFKHRRKTFFPTLILSGLLAGCSATSTFLQPGSMVSSNVADLFRIILYMAAGVFVLVWVLIIVAVVRFRQRDPHDKVEPRQKYGNTRLEITWTTFAVVLVLILFILTIRTMQAIAAPASSQTDIRVTVIGHQWWWEFDYPDLGIVTANELHLPVGENVQLVVTSADVIHSFWVPQLSHKVDAIPGQNNNLWFKPLTIDTYDGQCAEFCGANHANMKIKVIVESEADFQAWVKDQQAPPPQPVNDQQQQAYDLITQGVCHTCHTLGDIQGVSNLGPNLTHVMSRSVIAGGMYPTGEMFNWLSDPEGMKPGNKMVVHLTLDQVYLIMTYLTQLK